MFDVPGYNSSTTHCTNIITQRYFLSSITYNYLTNLRTQHPHISKKQENLSPSKKTTSQPTPLNTHTSSTQPNPTTMFSCANYPRGCRGRVFHNGQKCRDCVTFNFRRPARSSSSSVSSLAQPKNYSLSGLSSLGMEFDETIYSECSHDIALERC